MSERPEAPGAPEAGAPTPDASAPDAPAPDEFEEPEAPEAPEASEARRSRLPVLLAVLAAVLALGLAVLVPVLVQRVRASQEPSAAADLDAVRVFEGLANDHTDGDVDYETSPPAGGAHDAAWLDCGVYDEPIRDENAVHDLEHGTVWISYRPDLDDDDVGALTSALPENGILAPYDELPAPVVVTVWERQLRLTGVDDPRLALFLTRFSDGHTAPEPFASCVGGLQDGDGGDTTQI
jgi:hypothetical protein